MQQIILIDHQEIAQKFFKILRSERQNRSYQDDDVDRNELTKLVKIIKNEEQEYDDEEKRVIKEGKEFHEKCQRIEKMKILSSPDSRVEMKMVHVDKESLGSGIASAVVDATVEECAANEIIGLDSREKRRN